MFKKYVKLKGVLASTMLVFALSSMGSAFATNGISTNVDPICAAAGNTLLDQFQPTVSGNCTACHDDGDGGPGDGATAYLAGEAAIIAFFCPPVEPPVPPVEPPVPPVEPPVPPVEPPPLTCTDNDGDGFAIEGGDCGLMDCNDNDAAIFPGAVEDCGDGIDNNCNGLIDAADPNALNCPTTNVCTDIDLDGYSIEGGICGPMDCNDANPDLNPGASEICDDNIDNNCDGMVDSADVACQEMEEDEHRKDRHDRDRDEHDDEEDHDDDGDDDDDDDESESHDDDDRDDRGERRRHRNHDHD